MASVDGDIARALATLEALLGADETLQGWAAQHRLHTFRNRRVLLAATSLRFIALTRQLSGNYDAMDIHWHDLKEVRIRAGVVAADLTLSAQRSIEGVAATGRTWTYAGLRKDQAEALHGICRRHEEAWHERRRARELEEFRAKAGGLQQGAAYDAHGRPAGSAPAGESEPARRLRQAREMLDARLISDAEFESIKAKILAGL